LPCHHVGMGVIRLVAARCRVKSLEAMIRSELILSPDLNVRLDLRKAPTKNDKNVQDWCEVLVRFQFSKNAIHEIEGRKLLIWGLYAT
jgi:hypothetical protein